jgi:hypothetical protein
VPRRRLRTDVWTVDPASSSARLRGDQRRQPDEGESSASGTAEIQFDPEAPESAVISRHDPAQPAHDDRQPAVRRSPAAGKDWFDTAEHRGRNSTERRTFPGSRATATARRHADSIKRHERSRWNSTSPWTSTATSANARGSATIEPARIQDRNAAVGTDTVGDAVTVTLDLNAER